VSATDYYPFGWAMPGRTYTAASYKYGFNGKENDNEVKGDGNQQDYGMRIYDPRLGRFLSVDPISKKYAELTPYQFASNTPIVAVDIDGLESSVDFRYDRWDREFLSGNKTAEQIQKEQKTYGVSGVVGGGLTLDLMTGGTGLKILGALGILGLISDMNTMGNVKDPHYKKELKNGINNQLAYLVLGAAADKVMGTGSKLLKGNSLKSELPAQELTLERKIHIFGNTEHALESLVTKYGSEEGAFKAVQNAANQALAKGNLTPNSIGILPTGNDGDIIKVDGIDVRLIGGRVENDKVIISSFSRKDL
jgi:RHS repeat-associated protein